MGWVVNVTPRPLYRPGKTRYRLYRELGGPQGRSGQVRKISHTSGFDPRTVQAVASRYTDYDIPAHNIYNSIYTYIIYTHKTLYIYILVPIWIQDDSFPPTAVQNSVIFLKKKQRQRQVCVLLSCHSLCSSFPALSISNSQQRTSKLHKPHKVSTLLCWLSFSQQAASKILRVYQDPNTFTEPLYMKCLYFDHLTPLNHVSPLQKWLIWFNAAFFSLTP
jgi:hypothetical protein